MTIKELKEIISNHPDDMSVVFQWGPDEYISPKKSESKVKTLYSDEGENPYMLFEGIKTPCHPAGNDGMEEYEAFVLNRYK